MTDAERIAQLEAALAERDALLAQMRGAIETIPYGAYSEAMSEGCDADGAWGCFVVDCQDHLRPLLSADAARQAAEQWRQMRGVLAVLVAQLPTRDYGTVPVPVDLVLRARKALGQTEGEG